MKLKRGVLAIALMLGSNAYAFAPTPSPDNSAVNARDRKEGALTAENQSSKAADIELTQKIRRAVIENKTFSMNAKNIKIITVEGVVTLRGPVETSEEKSRIAAIAAEIAGANNVNNQLEVINSNPGRVY